MSEQLFIIILLIAVAIIIITITILSRLRLRKMVKNSWGKIPRVTNFDQENSLKQAFLEAKKYHQTDSEIDDITWYDLDMIRLFEELNHTYSSIGAEALYQRLRGFDFNQEDQLELEELIALYEKDPQLREDIEYAFATLGKRDNNFVVNYLSQNYSQRLGRLWQFIGLGLLPIVGILLVIGGMKFGIFITIGVLCFNLLYYLAKKQEVETELNSMAYLVQSIAVAKKIAKLKTPRKEELTTALKPLASILKFGFSFRIKSNTEAEMLFEYVNIIFMLPFISYHFIFEKVMKNSDAAITLWKILGEFEVAAAVLNYRSLLPVSCQPTFKKGGIKGETVYHPLISEPVANLVDWEKNTLVTGSNASGKSTYVKSIAINTILAQTIYTCCAEEFTLQRGHVLTSMAVEDDLFAGDSYFVAEIKSVKRVLAKVQTREHCYCFIDEILKGTNTIERISASSSIVKWLSQYSSLVYVATHDIELTEILRNYCQNVHFEEQVTEEDGVTFDYTLRAGPAKTRNAIRLLKVLNYPTEIVEKAQKEAVEFDLNRQWTIFE
ncbi:MutS-related protein [Enterococcus alishanensis]